MTENIPLNKQTKVIVHHHEGPLEKSENPISEDALLEMLVSEDPLFPIQLDAEMLSEDAENVERLKKWHSEKTFCNVIDPSTVSKLSIDEEGAQGMSLQWLTADNLELSPQFCTRKICLDSYGTTPERETSWEHQLYVLSGEGLLVEKARESLIQEGATVLVRPNAAFKVKNTGKARLIYLDIVPSITQYFGR